MQVLLRPAGARLAAGEARNLLKGIVQDAIFSGQAFRIELSSAGLPLHFSLTAPAPVGEALSLYLPPESILCFGSSGSEI